MICHECGKDGDVDPDLCAAAPALLAALQAVLRMDVRGHQLQDRLQFTAEGRAILAQCKAALSPTGGDHG